MTEPNSTTWKVTSQFERTEVNPAGQLTDGYKISFVTGEGQSGSIFVPLSKYTPDSVRQMIADAASKLDAVGQLTSES